MPLLHRSPRRAATLTSVLGVLALSLLAAAPMPAAAAVTCDKVAAATGSDYAAGTAAAPYATVQKLVNSLSSGQTGCVRGRIQGNVQINTAGVTLASEPGQRGTFAGEMIVGQYANNVTVRDLDIDGGVQPYPSPVILGDDATFANNDVTNRGENVCFILGQLGHHTGALAERTRFYANRIHNCGTSNNHEHGMYLEHAADTRIVGNVFYDNADRAIQLYPSAQRTTITGNVVDGNGEGIIFSGGTSTASSNNVVRNNVLTNPRIRAVVESWWGGPVGTGNLVENNCVFGSGIDTAGGGFTARNNLFTDPLYTDRAAKDFRLKSGSPCAALLEAGRTEAASWLPATTEPVPTPTQPAPTEPAPTEPAPTPTEPAPTPTEPAPAPTEPAPTPTEPAPSEPAPTKPKKEDPQPAKGKPRTTAFAAASQPVKLSIRRSPGTRSARLVVRLADGAEAVQALVEVRVGGRSWRPVASPRLSAGRAFVKTVRLPRGASRISARTSVLDEGGSVTTQFR